MNTSTTRVVQRDDGTSYEVRGLDGVEWINADGVAAVIGYKYATTSRLINHDPKFPTGEWLFGRDTKAGDRQWWRLADVQAYVNDRTAPIDADGADLDELLGTAAAAAEWGQAESTFRRGIVRSRPIWATGDLGHGYVPWPNVGGNPDDVYAMRPRDMQWTRRTLRTFARPGPGHAITAPRAERPAVCRWPGCRRELDTKRSRYCGQPDDPDRPSGRGYPDNPIHNASNYHYRFSGE